MSAGLLLYRRLGDVLEVLLVHPGGPFWARRDAGAWSILKGLVDNGEEPLAQVLRGGARRLVPSPDRPGETESGPGSVH